MVIEAERNTGRKISQKRRARYFSEISNENYERGFRDKTVKTTDDSFPEMRPIKNGMAEGRKCSRFLRLVERSDFTVEAKSPMKRMVVKSF